MSIIDKVKSELNSTDILKGYVLYFYDIKNLICKSYNMKDIGTTLEITETNELFELSDVAFYIEGKPVFIVIRKIPYSIKLELFNEIDSERAKLIEKGYSSDDIHAKIYSIYVKRVFGAKMLSPQYYIITALLMLATAMTTYILMSFGGNSGSVGGV